MSEFPTTRRPTQAVILAGGRGTRLRPITDALPKPMIEFHGKPFLAHLIEMLREQGFDDVLLLLGYLPEIIIDRFGDGRTFGIHIEYSVTEPDDLTTHRMHVARPLLDDGFLLMYCDNYWPMRMGDMWRQYVASGARAQVTVYTNRDGYSRDNVLVGEDGMVETYDPQRRAKPLGGVEIGYAILRRDLLDLLPRQQLVFEHALYPLLAQTRELHAYLTEHRYYSAGSLERLPLTKAFLARRPAIILDRDGVLNVRPPQAEYVRRPEDLRMLPGAVEALRLLNEAGYLVVVVSNQAGIGRGKMTTDDLTAVHARMRSEAEAAGGRIEAIYYCPHDWEDGCECRKPKPGMLFRAQREHHLDLTRTLFVGDDERDGQAAEAAGCPWVLVSERFSLLDLTRKILAGELATTEARL